MYRANRIDNGEVIEGYYLKIDGDPYIYEAVEGFCAGEFNGNDHRFVFADNFIEVHPESLAMVTGVKANDKMIYGSFEVKGEMTRGGDEVEQWDGNRYHLTGKVVFNKGRFEVIFRPDRTWELETSSVTIVGSQWKGKK